MTDSTEPEPSEPQPLPSRRRSRRHEPQDTVTLSETGSRFIVEPGSTPQFGKYRRFLPITAMLGILIIVFYALPALIPFMNFPPQSKPLLALLVIVNPVAIMIVNIVYSSMWRMGWLLAILGAALAIPSFYLFYNDSALIYAIFYLVVAVIGWLIGVLIQRTKKKQPFSASN